MDNYINYLLADIAAATANVPVPVLIYEDEEEIPFITAEEEAKTAPRKVLADLIGVQTEWFPPEGRLSDWHIQQVLEALTDCLDAYAFILNFPVGLPLRIRYRVLIEELHKEVPVLAHNIWQLDFCEYEPKGCPFGATYCQCKIYERWLDHLQDDTGDTLGLSEEGAWEEDSEEAGLPGFLFEETNESTLNRSYLEGDEELEDDFWEEEEESDSFFDRFWDSDAFFDDEDEGRWN